MQIRYTLNVGNIGNIPYTNIKEAKKDFAEYKRLSMENIGRAAGESVTLFDADNNILMEYIGALTRNQQEE